jgi:hypothetical protein
MILKRLFFCCLTVLAGLSCLGAWEMPSRFFELGIDAEAGVANNYLAWEDAFNSSRKLNIDLDKLGDDYFGLDFFFAGRFFMNVQTRGKHRIGVGVFSGVESSSFFTLSKEAMEFLFHGNGSSSSIEGSIAAGGSVFADVGLKANFQIGKLHFNVAPAMYIPLLYAAEPDVSYSFDSSDPVNGYLRVNTDIYSAVPLEGSFGAADIIKPKGFDLSLDVSYNFLPILDFGGSATHIPLFPAYMSNGAKIDRTYSINKDGYTLQELIENDGLDNILDPKPGKDDLESFSDARQAVFRPLRFTAYAFFKPFKKDWLALKPWIGLSTLTVYDGACFNFGLDFQLKIVNMLNFYYAFSRMETVWQNKLTIGINLRVLELDIGAGFRSRDFTGAFTVKGFYALAGLRLGF